MKCIEKKLKVNYMSILCVILNKPPHNSNCTATCFPSYKLTKLDKQDILGTAGDVRIYL